MKRLLSLSTLTLPILLASLNFAAPAHATDVINMTDSERDVFQAEIRDYLLQNPEVLMEAIAVLEKREAAAETVNDATLVLQNADEIFNDGVSYVGGNPDGDVTIVEFSDYRCPYCKKARPEVAELVASDGNIKIIYKEFPILGADSATAAKFAVAIQMLSGPKEYLAASQALMKMRGAPSDEALKHIADDIGLDSAAVMQKMQSPEVAQLLQANRALGQKLKISGTPTFVVGSQMVRGYLPADTMREIVAQERAQPTE